MSLSYIGKSLVVFCSHGLSVMCVFFGEVTNTFDPFGITSPPEVQLARIKSRDGLSEEDALARINAQRPLIEKVGYADYVINNTSDLVSLKQSTVKVMEVIQPSRFWTVLAYLPPITVLMATWVILKRYFKGDPRKTKTWFTSSSSPAHAS